MHSTPFEGKCRDAYECAQAVGEGRSSKAGAVSAAMCRMRRDCGGGGPQCDPGSLPESLPLGGSQTMGRPLRFWSDSQTAGRVWGCTGTDPGRARCSPTLSAHAAPGLRLGDAASAPEPGRGPAVVEGFPLQAQAENASVISW